MDEIAKIETARLISNELVGVRELPVDSIRRYLAIYDLNMEPIISSRRQWVRGALAGVTASTLSKIASDLGISISAGAAMQSQKFDVLRANPQLERDFDECVDDIAGVGLIFFDIDTFKVLNTTYTETVIDECLLVPLTCLIEESVRGRGYGYSVGGDEFIVLLRNTSQQEALAFAKRLHVMIGDRGFAVRDEKISITLSMGVATYPHDAETIPDLRRKANEAESHAKKIGKNRVVAYWQDIASSPTKALI